MRPTVGTSHPSEAGIPALPIRRLRTAFYAAGHLLPIDFADRVALLERRERILDLAEALLDLADAMDAPLEDREPEPIEAEDDEATLQPVTLAPDWVQPVKVRPGSLATGLRNACLAGTGFWMLVGLAGWGLA
ncbi:MAG: hypothetical protein DI601_18330 [Azospirillum brasilense]|nr:MAG: hypothetical protein DI601_18330 [Azospirillum brasilense]